MNLNLNAIFLVIHSFMLFVIESKWYNKSIESIYLETIVEVSHILLVYREHREYIPGDYSGGFSYTSGI